MVISRNKPLQVFISLLMILIIFIQFGTNVYADFVIAPTLGVKVLVSVLGAMGVLTWVNSNGGVQSFTDGFIRWLEDMKGIDDALRTMGSLAVESIVNKTKMNIASIKDLVFEYWDTVISKPLDSTAPIEGLPTLEIADGRISWSLDTQVPDISSSDVTGFGGYSPYFANNYYESVPIGSGYNIVIGLTRDSNYDYISTGVALVRDGVTVRDVWLDPRNGVNYNARSLHLTNSTTYKFVADRPSYRVIRPGDRTYNMAIQFDYDSETGGNILSMRVVDYQDNKTYEHSLSNALNLNGLAGLNLEGNISGDVGVNDIPKARDIADSLPLPWQNSLYGVNDYVGQPVQDLIDDIADVPVQTWVDGVIGYPATQWDTLTYPKITVNEQGVIEGIKDVAIDIPRDPPVDLGGIETGISGILGFLTDMFTVPDDISLDFAPLKALIPKEKFPFSIPWDYANLIGLFKSDPIPPKFEIEILNEELVVDFTQFEMWAKITRNTLSVIFIVGLMFSTRKLMIGGS